MVDPYTIRFIFKRTFAEQVEGLAPLSIMPKHLLEKVAPAEMRNAAFNHRPVGNGPFRFVRWQANEEIVFEANDTFSRRSAGGRFSTVWSSASCRSRPPRSRCCSAAKQMSWIAFCQRTPSR